MPYWWYADAWVMNNHIDSHFGISEREEWVKTDPKIQKWVSQTSKDVFIVKLRFLFLDQFLCAFILHFLKPGELPSHTFCARACSVGTLTVQGALRGVLTAGLEESPGLPKVKELWAHILLVKTLPLHFTTINPLSQYVVRFSGDSYNNHFSQPFHCEFRIFLLAIHSFSVNGKTKARNTQLKRKST